MLQAISANRNNGVSVGLTTVPYTAWPGVLLLLALLGACAGPTKDNDALPEIRLDQVETATTGDCADLADRNSATLPDAAAPEQDSAGLDQLPDAAAPEQDSAGPDQWPDTAAPEQDSAGPDQWPDTAADEQDSAGPDPWSQLESLVDDVLLSPSKQVTAAGLSAILAEDPDHFVIVDLRGESLWAQGHIAGAVPVSLGELPAFLAADSVPSGQPLLLVCHAGQQSAWAASLANLMGFDAWSLQWGMPAWNVSGGNMWASACNDQGLDLKVTDSVPEPPPGNFPVVEVDDGDVQTFLHAQAGALLAGTFKTKTLNAVANSLDQYFIVAHISQQEFDAGHLPGAIRFDPGVALDADAQLDLLPPADPILVYDCTGEGAATVAAALNVLGYDAWFVKFGVSSAWCSDLDCAWSSDNAGSYPVNTAADGK